MKKKCGILKCQIVNFYAKTYRPVYMAKKKCISHGVKTRCEALSFDGILTAALRPIVRSSEKFQVRVLRSSEFEIIRDSMGPDTRRISTSLLLTGMRYAELQRFRENPDWLDVKFIYLP